MGILLSYYMCLLLCVIKDIFGIFSTEKYIDQDSVILTCFVMPILLFLWDITEILFGFADNIVANRIFGFLGCFLIVFLYVLGCCCLESFVIGKKVSKVQVFREKGIGVKILLSACMLLAGVGGGINVYLGYWIIFLAYCIVTLVFVITNIPEKSLQKILNGWKEKDGIFLILVKLMVVGTSIYEKTLLFFNLAQPWPDGMYGVLNYKWVRDLESLLFRMQYYGDKYVFFGLIPCLLVLFVVAVLRRKKTNQNIKLIWGIVMLAECFLFGLFGSVLCHAGRV